MRITTTIHAYINFVPKALQMWIFILSLLSQDRRMVVRTSTFKNTKVLGGRLTFLPLPTRQRGLFFAKGFRLTQSLKSRLLGHRSSFLARL